MGRVAVAADHHIIAATCVNGMDIEARPGGHRRGKREAQTKPSPECCLFCTEHGELGPRRGNQRKTCKQSVW